MPQKVVGTHFIRAVKRWSIHLLVLCSVPLSSLILYNKTTSERAYGLFRFALFARKEMVIFMKVASSTWMMPGDTFTEKMKIAARMGFEGMEIRLFESDISSKIIHELLTALQENALAPCSLLVPGDTFRRPLESEEALSAKKQHAIVALETAAQIDCPTVIAPEYRYQNPLPLFDHPRRPSGFEKELLLEYLRFVDERAKEAGASALIEPINRYETHFYYSLSDCAQVLSQAGTSNIKIMADMFHMNMEEVSVPDAFREYGHLVGHVQLGDSNRMLPGQGHTDFCSSFKVLKQLPYEGYLALECSVNGDPFVELPKCVSYLKHLIDRA